MWLGRLTFYSWAVLKKPTSQNKFTNSTQSQ